MNREWGNIIAHVDLDAFYAQCEVKKHPWLAGLPVCVAQYNPYEPGGVSTLTPDQNREMNDSDGSLIAVSYEARASGVKRIMRGQTAKAACPDLHIVQVPTHNNKADLSFYRAEGHKVMEVLAEGLVCEKASIDECYLDCTLAAQTQLAASNGVPAVPPAYELSRVHVTGEGDVEAWWRRPAREWAQYEAELAAGAALVAAARERVQQRLGYSTSAGVAPTKLLAKLCSGLHKPRQQTVVSIAAVPGLLKDLPIAKLRSLGGLFGEEVQQKLNISTVGELKAVPYPRLDSMFGEKCAMKLARLSVGLDDEEVKARLAPKSIGCSKTFRGASALTTIPDVLSSLQLLGAEVEERLNEDRDCHRRIAQQMTVSVAVGEWVGTNRAASFSRSCPLRKVEAAVIAADALSLIRQWAGGKQKWAITSLGLSTSGFASAPTGGSTLKRFLRPCSNPQSAVNQYPVHNAVLSAAAYAATAEDQHSPPPQRQPLDFKEPLQHQHQQQQQPQQQQQHHQQQQQKQQKQQQQQQHHHQQQEQQHEGISPMKGMRADAFMAGRQGRRTNASPNSRQQKLSGLFSLQSSNVLQGDSSHGTSRSSNDTDGSQNQALEPRRLAGSLNERHSLQGSAPVMSSSRSSSWMNEPMAHEVDAEVLSQLPLSMQAEIRHSLKRQHDMQRISSGSTASHSFSKASSKRPLNFAAKKASSKRK